jgi:hypothetical protein
MHIQGKQSFIISTYTDSKASTYSTQEGGGGGHIKNIKIIFTDCPAQEYVGGTPGSCSWKPVPWNSLNNTILGAAVVPSNQPQFLPSLHHSKFHNS